MSISEMRVDLSRCVGAFLPEPERPVEKLTTIKRIKRPDKRNLTSEQRKHISKLATGARWSKPRPMTVEKQRRQDGTCMSCGAPRDAIGLLCVFHRQSAKEYQQKLRDEGRAV